MTTSEFFCSEFMLLSVVDMNHVRFGSMKFSLEYALYRQSNYLLTKFTENDYLINK